MLWEVSAFFKFIFYLNKVELQCQVIYFIDEAGEIKM